MFYEAQLIYSQGNQRISIVDQGDSDVEAVDRVSARIKGVSVSPFQVVLIVWHVYPNARQISYTSTLGQYRIAVY
jgi:hypothetical protein